MADPGEAAGAGGLTGTNGVDGAGGAGGVGLHVAAYGVGQRVRGGRETLDGVHLAVAPGEVLALAGGSGSGKTTLLEILAGIRLPARGRVLHDGADPAGLRPALGYLPHGNVMHEDLPLVRALSYAARLRMPAGAGPERRAAAVDGAMAAVGLSARADQRVRTLSEGERRRACIAVELLTRPRVLFLDEPTTGLDPASGAELMRTLRDLAGEGVTVVLTTHAPADLARCDRVLFLTPDGRPAYLGRPRELTRVFAVPTVEEVYAAVARRGARELPELPEPDAVADGFTRTPGKPAGRDADRPLGAAGQWWLLTRRSTELMLRSRLTAAVVVGSPVVIVAMFALLFRPGAFDPAAPSPGSAAMILFWIAFGGFFFGLTYGLLQVSTELPVVRRERLTALRLGPYLLSKAALLMPVLAGADALLLAVLRGLNRLPAAGWGTYGSLFTTVLLASAAALALGLLASAAVAEPQQATLMLPLLCFPQVLFSGAFVPVPQMAWAGRLLSAAMTNRWAFEGLGGGIGLPGLWAHGASPLGPPLLASYGDSFGRAVWADWLLLAGFTVLFLSGAWAVLASKCRTVHRPAPRTGPVPVVAVSTPAEG
ncbi:ABC-type multidrug transport system, ATPase component [Actinacidiphila yanglinensis]|uniref:ABC-type multidrug transport system, ATPase component n=1 Tax=Actinacidiphila yanglinensis TaxID=310779 RepID=A0A1H5TZU3_9ACTN|nr:ATP-binding cassette domain-containing protein [Actinacidiphila yanglinensis]SEF68260.1 ABC-type multidrug transport system, ATPase component [Actinacidiphila yanglinensis]